MRQLTKGHVLGILLALVAPFAAFGFVKWREAGRNGGQEFAEPFRIAGNLYYVGASDTTSFLLTGPLGHVLIDGGLPGTPPLIMASIAKLGFDIRDVKVLLNSGPRFDHAGGLAELQKASGAELWASEDSAFVMATGGDEGEYATLLPMRVFIWAGITRYAAPRVDHRFKDGATISLGPIKLTAHITGGNSRGCTTWSFPVHDGKRELQRGLAARFRVAGRTGKLPGDSGRLRAHLPGAAEPSHRYLGDRTRTSVGQVPQIRRKRQCERPGGTVHGSGGLSQLHRQRRGGVQKASRGTAGTPVTRGALRRGLAFPVIARSPTRGMRRSNLHDGRLMGPH